MKIPQLKKIDILNLEVKSDFDSLSSYLENNQHNSTIEINIDLERWKTEMKGIDAINQTYDFFDDIIENAASNLKNIDFDSHTLNGIITAKFDNKTSKIDFIDTIFESLNESIQDVISSKIGHGFKLFIKQKQDEAQDELLNSYENYIRKISYEKLQNRLSENDFSAVLKSDAMPFSNFDMNVGEYKINENRSIKLPREKGRDRSQLDAAYSKLISSPYIESLEQVQKNNASLVEVKSTTKAQELVKSILLESTEEFYKNPRYSISFSENTAEFIGRVNDGKGEDADIYKAAYSNTLYFVRSDDEYCGEELLGRENKELLKRSKLLLENFSNKQDEIIKKRIKNNKPK